MKIYLLNPSDVPSNPHLFPSFIPTWERMGCEIVSNVKYADIIFWDMHTRLSGYNQDDIDYIVKHEIPTVSFDEYDRLGMSEDLWPYPLTSQMAEFWFKLKLGIERVHFCRLMDSTKFFPDNVFPYEKGIIYEEPLLTPDELFNRQYDICFIANTAPARQSIAKAIESDGRFKSIIQLGWQKIPFQNWVNAHKQAKLFISASGGGATDERKQALFSIAGLVLEQTNQVLANPFTHLSNCIKISSNPTKQELDTIYEIANNKEKLYLLYKNNYDFMKQYYSNEYIAEDILNKVLKYVN